jgi:hypothetical protein
MTPEKEMPDDTPAKDKKSLLHRISFLTLAGLIVGAAAGYLYFIKVGCISGTCPITSNPWLSSAWGAAIGYLVFGLFKPGKSRT